MGATFHFSPLNYDLCKSDGLNLLWNQMQEKSKTDSLMFMVPNFNFSIGMTYPEFGMYGNQLLNPMLAIQQTMRQWNNGNWNGLGNFGNFGNFGGFNFSNLWGNWSNSGNGGNGESTTGSSEYNSLKALIQKYKELGTDKDNTFISTEMLDKINKALNKSGKEEEKLEALREVYKELKPEELKRALLEMPETKKELQSIGYKFLEKEGDKDAENLRTCLNRIETELDTGKVEALQVYYSGNNGSDILRDLSVWNDTRSGNKRSMVRLLAQHISTDKTVANKQREAVEVLKNALKNKSEAFRGKFSSNLTKLKEAELEMEKAFDALNGENNFTKENLNKFADKFEKVYAMLRIMEAEKIRNNLQTKYGFLNDISDKDTDFVNDKLVVEATKNDLRNEGISLDSIKTDEIPKKDVSKPKKDYSDFDTNKERIEKLAEDGELKETEYKGVYKTKLDKNNASPKFYMVTEDDKLVELKDVKSIDKDGNCTLIDETKEKLDKVKTEEVTPDSVQSYKNTVEKIDSMVKEGRLICSNDLSNTYWPKGVKLYWSKGKRANGKRQYFVIRNGELKRIDCDHVAKFGKILMNDHKTWKNLSELTDEDFISVDKTDVLKENEANPSSDKPTTTPTPVAKVKAKQLDLSSEEVTNGIKSGESFNGEDLGKQISDFLVGYTSDSDWSWAKNTILTKLNVDNIYGVLKAYTDEDVMFGSDNILEQIATESDRSQQDKQTMINKIIKLVIEFGAKYGADNVSSYEELCKYKLGIAAKTAEDSTECKKIDHLILDVMGIKNY